MRDAVLDGVTGVLVDNATPATFAASWIELAGDEPARVRLGEAAQERARNYTWDKMVDAWQVTLTDTVALGGAPALGKRCQRSRPESANTSERVE